MGIISDYFAADEAELARVTGGGDEPSNGPTVTAFDPFRGVTQTLPVRDPLAGLPVRRMKGVDPAQLDLLCAALRLDVDASSVPPLHEEGDGEAMIFELPSVLVSALGGVDDSHATTVAEQWANQLRADYETIGDARARAAMVASVREEDQLAIVNELRSLAHEAASTRRKLFLYLAY